MDDLCRFIAASPSANMLMIFNLFRKILSYCSAKCDTTEKKVIKIILTMFVRGVVFTSLFTSQFMNVTNTQMWIYMFYIYIYKTYRCVIYKKCITHKPP